MTAVLWEDFLKGRYARRLGDRKTVSLTKVVATVFGLIATGLAFLCQYVEGLVQVMALIKHGINTENPFDGIAWHSRRLIRQQVH